jgi:ribosomal protein S18 acetylase RimI-like enzyme
MEVTIKKATINDAKAIVSIGKIAVELAHRNSAPPGHVEEYLEKNYTDDVIQQEIRDAANTYHIIYYKDQPAGFSKIVLNAPHTNIPHQNVTKLDRIYLLTEFFNLKLGQQLLQHNINFSKQNNQAGMWLFTWVENKRAVNFYFKAGFTIIGSHMFKVTETHSNPNHHMMLTY